MNETVPDPTEQWTAAQLSKLRDLLLAHFGLEDLRLLSADLGLVFEDLPGDTRPGKAQSLLEYLNRRGRLPELLHLCARRRPHVAWPGVTAEASPHSQAADPFTRYHQERAQHWSQPRYQYDDRFVNLTLLLDQGADTPGIRFVPDSNRGKYNSLAALLADLENQEIADRVIVLLGDPGSGKTTLLRRLQWERAVAELAAPTRHTSLLAPLSSYYDVKLDQPPPDPETWLAQQWRQLGRDLPDFGVLFRQGRFLLLLDGLNEMPHQGKEDYRAHIERWRLFLQQNGGYGNTVVFSCRSLEYSAPLSSELTPVRQVRVEPLSREQIETFLRLYLPEAADHVWQALRRETSQLELFANPFFLRLLVEQVAATGEILRGQAALLTGFVRRALHREINEHHHPLFRPGVLLSEDDYEQVLHPEWISAYDLPQDGLLISHLEKLALSMQDNRRVGQAGEVRVPETTARQLLEHAQARDIIAAGVQLNVLDKERARRELFFYHQLIQEYFAARVLARTPQPYRVKSAWRVDEIQPSLAEEVARLEVSDPLPPAPTTGWEETTLLAAAMTPEQERFIHDLMSANLPLAARCAASPDVTVSPALVGQLQTALLARIGDPEADLRARIAAAEALGELGDPRFERRTGPHGEYLRPLLAAMPAGTYTIGDDDSQYDDEKPAHPVEIAALEIGVFPVTNAEYRLFMEAGGYEDERWWQTEAARAWLRGEGSSEGPKQHGRDLQTYLQDFSQDVLRAQKASPDQIEFWLWLRNASSEEMERQYEEWYPAGKVYRQPDYWNDSRFNHPAQPVVGVTWYEARAYCAWLSAQMGHEVTLPTEVEWEAAARGREGRMYAYGNDYDAGRCNTFETHIRRTTPVGVFPGGQTPEGIADLSGNVWEWTTTVWGSSLNRPDFPYPYVATDGREDMDNATARRVVRGGSWSVNADYARAAYRYGAHPDFRHDDVGWRLVVRRPPSYDH